jgi:hypothetical protein
METAGAAAIPAPCNAERARGRKIVIDAGAEFDKDAYGRYT